MKGDLLLVCILGLLAAGACTPGRLGLDGPTDEEVAWQALAQQYDLMIKEQVKHINCSASRLIYVFPVESPELKAVFPDTRFFRGGGRKECVGFEYFRRGNIHGVVAVRQGKAYPMLINTGRWGSIDQIHTENEGFQGFNRLLKDSGLTVTPENQEAIARVVVAMLMFYDYPTLFDEQGYASPETAAPADYRLGQVKAIDEYPRCLASGEYDKVGNEHFTLGLPAWTAQKGRASWWRVAFQRGQVTLVEWRGFGLDVAKTDFEAVIGKRLSETDPCHYDEWIKMWGAGSFSFRPVVE